MGVADVACVVVKIGCVGRFFPQGRGGAEEGDFLQRRERTERRRGVGLGVADVAGVVVKIGCVGRFFPQGRRGAERGLFTTTRETGAKWVRWFGRRSRCWRGCKDRGVWDGYPSK